MKPNKLRLNNVAAIGVLVAAMCLGIANAGAQEFFTSPEDAVDRLVAAIREGKSSRIVSVLGGSASSRQIVESGDPVADAKARATFIAAYDARHRLVGEHSQQENPSHRRQGLAVSCAGCEVQNVVEVRPGLPGVRKSFFVVSAETN